MFARPKFETNGSTVISSTKNTNNRVNTAGSNIFKKEKTRGNQGNVSYESPSRALSRPLDVSSSSLHRLDRLEDVVNKLTNQYDALMPLLNLVENAPLLIKKENLIANLQKRFQQTDERSHANFKSLESIYGQIEIIKQDLQHQLNNEIRAFENKFHNQEQKMSDSLRQIQNNEAKLTKTVNKIEGKQREELQISLKKYDQRYQELDSQMKQLNLDVQEKLQALDVERQKMKRSTVMRRDSVLSNKNTAMISQVENQVEKKIQDFSNQVLKQIDNISNDLGIIQCEYEMQNENEKRGMLNEQAHQFPKDIAVGQRMLKINNIEYLYVLENLERYNVENTQRIVYELKNADEQISQYDQLSKQYPANFQALGKDLEQFEQKVMTLKNQVEGTNKKATSEILKIEDLNEKLKTLKDKCQEDLSGSQLGLSMHNDEQQIDEIKQSVEGNIQLLNENLAQVQDKLSKYQTQRNLYLHQYSYMQSELTQKDDASNSAYRNSGRQNTSYTMRKQNKLKDSFIKRSLIQADQNRSNYTNDDSYQ